MKRQKNRSGRVPLGIEWVVLVMFGYLGIMGLINKAEEYHSKAHLVRETSNQREIKSSHQTGFCRAYDFDNDGLLDKIESASYSYRHCYLKWHDVDKKSSLYAQIQGEYSALLNKKKN